MPNWTTPPCSGLRYDEETGEHYAYEKYNSQTDEKPVRVTYHSDGGKTYHLGGPCGDAYVDRNGDS